METRALFQHATEQWRLLKPQSRVDALPLLKSLEVLCDDTVNLYLIDMRADDPLSYGLDRVIENVSLRGGGALLRHYPDQDYINRDVIPFYKAAKESCEINVMRLTSRIQDQIATYDRLILPTPGPGCEVPWAVTLSKTRLLLPNPQKVLTGREEDILDLLAHGLSSKEVARQLGISPRTVEHRLASIKEKLGARNVTHAVAMAVARHLIDAPKAR